MACAQPDSKNAAAVLLRGVDLIFAAPDGGAPVAALRDIHLRLDGGERAALVGPSGSGKTSLLSIIAGLQTPSGGEARIFGRDLAALDEDARAALRGEQIGVVFQHFHLMPTLTALENVALPLELAGRDEAETRAAEALAAVGLAARAGHYPRQLSGGEQQRVAIARAFAPRPRLLLADEPTGNLDSESSAVALDALFDLVDSVGATMLFITHDREILPRFSRVLTIRDGALAESDSPARA